MLHILFLMLIAAIIQAVGETLITNIWGVRNDFGYKALRFMHGVYGFIIGWVVIVLYENEEFQALIIRIFY